MVAQSRPSILVTRPAEASTRFVGQLRRDLGPDVPIVVSPLIAPRFLSPPLPESLQSGQAKGLIFTSATGVGSFARIAADRDLPAYCVGKHTASVACRAGFDGRACGADADALVATLTRTRPAAPLIHARGVHSRGEISARLSDAGIETVDLIVYEQVDQPLSEAAGAILNGKAPVIVALFSPRSAALFSFQARQAKAPILAVAISAATAQALDIPTETIAVAAAPDALAMAQSVALVFAAASAP